MPENSIVTLPQFPLSIVVFPNEPVNLHIFEPRYRQLVTESFDNNTTFGIPPFHNGEMVSFGTEVKVLEISKTYDDGKMDIKTKGLRVYEIHSFEKQMLPKLYPSAEVSFLENIKHESKELTGDILVKMKELFKLLNVPINIDRFTTDFSSFAIAHHIGLSIEQKIKLLSIKEETIRLELIKNHLEDFLPAVQQAEEVKVKAKQNGHFKKIQPPDF